MSGSNATAPRQSKRNRGGNQSSSIYNHPYYLVAAETVNTLAISLAIQPVVSWASFSVYELVSWQIFCALIKEKPAFDLKEVYCLPKKQHRQENPSVTQLAVISPPKLVFCGDEGLVASLAAMTQWMLSNCRPDFKEYAMGTELPSAKFVGDHCIVSEDPSEARYTCRECRFSAFTVMPMKKHLTKHASWKVKRTSLDACVVQLVAVKTVEVALELPLSFIRAVVHPDEKPPTQHRKSCRPKTSEINECHQLQQMKNDTREKYLYSLSKSNLATHFSKRLEPLGAEELRCFCVAKQLADSGSWGWGSHNGAKGKVVAYAVDLVLLHKRALTTRQ